MDKGLLGHRGNLSQCIVDPPRVCIELVGCNVADRAFCFTLSLGSSFSSAHVIESSMVRCCSCPGSPG